jgi:hypothetical protein
MHELLVIILLITLCAIFTKNKVLGGFLFIVYGLGLWAMIYATIESTFLIAMIALICLVLYCIIKK